MTEAEEQIVTLLREIRDLLRPKDEDAAALAAILAALPERTVFSSADVLARAKKVDPALDLIITQRLGWNSTTAIRLGKLFAAGEGTPIEGLRIVRSKREHGAVLWTVERV